MKKALKITGIVIAAIIVLLLVAPYLFKGQILTIAKTQINKNLNANVEFSDLNLSLIKSFPNLNVELEELSVTGKEAFQNDTLIRFDRFVTNIDLMSIIQNNIKIIAIELHHPVINAMVLENGQANWDIMKSDTTATEEPEKEPTEQQEESDFQVSLKKFEISEAYIQYKDFQSNTKAEIKNLNYLLKGNMAKDFTTLVMEASIDEINAKYGGVNYLKNASFGLSADIAADMKKNIYTLKKNQISLNEFTLTLNGSTQMTEDQTILDFRFHTNQTSFKTLLSLVPAIYTRDFDDIQTKGELTLKGEVNGILAEESLPSAKLYLNVKDAMFSYPDMPRAVENILIDLAVLFDGSDQDNTEIHLNQFHVEMAGNPFDMKMDITTPMSDPAVDASMNGTIYFSSIKHIIPMDDIEIEGVLKTDVRMQGRSSMIENENYEAFNAKGEVDLSKFKYAGAEVPKPVYIDRLNMIFSPQFVELTEFKSRIGQSDFQMQGKIENFIPYALSDDTLGGTFTFNSNNLNLNEFMADTETEIPEGATEEQETTDTTALTVVEVPGNLDFTLTSTINKLLYDDLDINNILGIIKIYNSKVELTNLSMNMLKGSMIMDGYYSTQNPMKPAVDFSLDISGFDIQDAANSFSIIEEYAPIAKRCEGKFSSEFSFTSILDQHMQPMYETVNGKGSLSSRNVEVKSSKTLQKIADKLNNDKFKELDLKDLNIYFEIKEGRIFFEPFEINALNTEMAIEGSQGIDQTMDYTVDMSMPRSDIGNQANQVINSLASKAASKGIDIQPGTDIKLGLTIKGTFDDPKVGLKLKGAEEGESIQEQVLDAGKEKVKEVVKEKTEDVKKEASEKAKKIIKEAEQKAAQIKRTARATADKIRDEADDKADRLIDEANNPIAKAAAKKTAKKIKDEADDKADKVIREADQRAQRIIREAKTKAAKLEE